MIEAALAQSLGLETIEDVEAFIADGSYQAWFGRNSCIITEVGFYPRGKVLNVVHGGGDLKELLDEMEPALCDWARQIGCRAIMGVGRKGWERACRAKGYRHAWTAMFKPLEN